ncbi:hypothetical protein [Muricoccus pecuniae]|uniref:Uncharacterized protein n=1 Tax=Muricoccus pecuniae TaxID=693023 RepID=A0A840YII0_9PROT|nr:hypothetical protein [Roseomonas pecuniae]MBB5694402.1 hypothetical protein [Roseomonas pecuniae]
MTAMSEAVLHVNFIRAVAITPRVRDLIISVGGQFAIVAPTNGGAFLGHLRLVSIGGRFHLCADLTTFLPDSQLSTGELSAAQDIRALALERSTPADLLAKRFMLAVEAANYDTVRDRRLDRLDAAKLDADAPVEAALDGILASATTVIALYAAGQLDPDQAAKMLAELPGLSG